MPALRPGHGLPLAISAQDDTLAGLLHYGRPAVPVTDCHVYAVVPARLVHKIQSRRVGLTTGARVVSQVAQHPQPRHVPALCDIPMVHVRLLVIYLIPVQAVTVLAPGLAAVL